MKPATIFILVPAYNAEKFVGDTLESILGQSFSDWEVLVLDDASTDNTYTVAHEYSIKDNRIRVLRNERNLGMMGNWNKGIDFCQSPYFVKLDADDLWHPTLLEKSLSALEKDKDVGIVFSRYINIDERGHVIEGSDLKLPGFAKDQSFYCAPIVKEGPARMLSYHILRQGLSIMRSEAFKVVGKYEHFQSADSIFYFKLGLHYKIHCIDEILYFYRIHASSDSARIQNEGIRPFLLYQIKNEITEYYYKNGKLTAIEFKAFKDIIKFDYNLFLISKNRKELKLMRFASLILENIRIDYKRLISFYIMRVQQKLGRRG